MEKKLAEGKQVFDVFFDADVLALYASRSPEELQNIVDTFIERILEINIHIEKDSIADMTDYILKYNNRTWHTGFVENKTFAVAVTLYVAFSSLAESHSLEFNLMGMYLWSESAVSLANPYDYNSMMVCESIMRFTKEVATKGV